MSRCDQRSLVKTSIDDLPEEILVHIISFLPTPTAVQTSAIGPSWRNLWHSIPILHFDMNEFVNNMRTEGFSWELRRQFADLVNQTLFHCTPKSPLGIFKLDFHYLDIDYFRSCVNSWVRFAISCRPVELDLCLRVDHSFNPNDEDEDEEEEVEEAVFSSLYPLQCSYLVNSTVQVLSLSGCDIICCPSSLFLFSSIREMHLTLFVGDVERLIASCVDLEILTLKGGFHLPSLTIASPKLKHCNLQDLSGGDTEMVSIEIQAPKLESIHIASVEARKYVFKGAPALAVAHLYDLEWWDVNVLSFISGVERLNIQNKWSWAQFTFQFGEALFSESLVFDKLKHLELLTSYLIDDLLGLGVLLNKCPLLVTMALVFDYESYLFEEEENEITDRPFALHMPRLRIVEMKQFRGTRNELYVVGLLKKHGIVLEKIVAYPGGLPARLAPPFVL